MARKKKLAIKKKDDIEKELEKLKEDMEDSEDSKKKEIDTKEPNKKEKPKKEGLFGKLRKRIKKDSKKKKEEDIKQDIVMDSTSEKGGIAAGYNENVMTPDDFNDIEKDEKTIENIEKVDAKGPEKPLSEANVIDQMMMKIERQAGRIIAIDDMNKSIQERISNLSEEIGELRSSVLEKERTLNKIETQSKRVIDAFEEIEPENFKKELNKKEEEIIKNQAQIESLLLKHKELKDTIEKLENIMEKVKSFENLVEISEKIEGKFSQIEENKKYTSRLTSKVENIFSELNNRLKDFRDSMEKIDMNEETIKELMKSVDMMEIKVEKIVTKDKLEEIKKSIEEKMKNNKIDFEDKIYDLKDFLEDIISKSGGIKLLKSRQVMPWRIEMEKKMNEIEKLLGSSKSDIIKIGNFRRELEELKRNVKGLDRSDFKREMEGLKKNIRRLDRMPQKKSEEKPVKNIVVKEVEKIVPKQEVPAASTAKSIQIADEPTEEIPINVEKWMTENLNKGFSLEELKESLRRGGYDPSFVDIFLAKKTK
ncbi:MAG: hypothetical protein KAT37_03490 [Candidatus Aenigmarchaeota archaeon]|nr:hypothetical protein [Candidatus Aenigmarchaeota archaeon]